MNDTWLEIADENINIEEIMEQIHQRLEKQGELFSSSDPVEVANTLRQEIIGDPENSLISNRIPIRPQDCDIIPRNYKIEWRIPIVGHIHALVRRVIDNEIRLFLFPVLDKQIRYNRRTLWVMRALVEENLQLREDVKKLKKKIEQVQK